jgi:predicted ATPase/DNA-binding CsgD family transcriptional regulator
MSVRIPRTGAKPSAHFARAAVPRRINQVKQGWVPPDVSAREAEVLLGVAEHLTNAEIGAKLFISIRTVESHVSSLLRKLAVGDRRALAGVAANLRATSVMPGSASDPASRAATWPSPLTSFIGRASERAALAAALDTHRLVTAVGPGGIGKTRLAQVVAADVTDRYVDGAWYVDLVPVTDPAMVAATLAAALGLGEQQGRSAEDTVRSWLVGRDVLLVLDNCEHVTDGVVVLVERLLATCPQLVVMATSRARLLVPYEWVFAVPGLSVLSGGDSAGDAVDLFLARATATGSSAAAADRGRIAAICQGLEGVALAIELAAARLPALGLDGLEAGLADRLQLLTGGRRIDDRHRSLRSALDWSYALLEGSDQAVLRRVSVFATPFSVADAVTVIADRPPPAGRGVTTSLAALADQSLLVAVPGRDVTRYRALETIRQYASERLAAAGELADARGRHIRWCLDAATALGGGEYGTDDGAWRAAFDQIADELRGALGWAVTRPEWRAEAYRLAMCLAELSFVRGMPGESQRRYEQAAALAETENAAAAALRLAAGAASAGHSGDDALRLHRAAADAALRAGDRSSAGRDLAQAAEFINRCVGLIADLPSADEVDTLLAEARALSAGDLVAEARARNAEAFAGREADPATAVLTEEALALARRSGDLLAESAALDQYTCVQLARGDVQAAAASALRRTELLTSLPVRADIGLEVSDAFCMATETTIAAGDLRTARELAERVRDLPFYREEGQLATARLLVVTALAGDWEETGGFADRFREGWERAGRRQDGNINRGAYAAATVYGLRGDDAARTAWIEVAYGLTAPARANRDIHCYEFFDGLLLLHQGRHHLALQRLANTPADFREWHNGLWRPWYAAVWAEAAVLGGDPSAPDRIRQARQITAGNPIAAAIVDRAEALADGDRDQLLAAASALEPAGCRYQWARTLIFAGGEERERGEAVMTDMGATAMGTGTAA